MEELKPLYGKKVLVTGGAGFIGSNLAKALSTACEVTVVDNLSSGFRENIAGLDIEFVEMDILDDRLRDLLEKVAVVFHLAANVSVDYSLDDPAFDARNNVLGLINLLESCRRHSIPRIVFSSSSAVYSNDVPIPTQETDITTPNSPYGITKLVGEYYMFLYNRLYNMRNISLRYFNAFGPQQDPVNPYSGVIAIFADRYIRGQTIEIHGTGEQTRDFIHVSDIVRMNILAACYNGIVSQPVNVGTGIEKNITDIIRSIDRDYARIEYRPGRIGDTLRSAADVSFARDTFGFNAQVDFKKGIQSYVEWMKGTL